MVQLVLSMYLIGEWFDWWMVRTIGERFDWWTAPNRPCLWSWIHVPWAKTWSTYRVQSQWAGYPDTEFTWELCMTLGQLHRSSSTPIALSSLLQFVSLWPWPLALVVARTPWSTSSLGCLSLMKRTSQFWNLKWLLWSRPSWNFNVISMGMFSLSLPNLNPFDGHRVFLHDSLQISCGHGVCYCYNLRQVIGT